MICEPRPVRLMVRGRSSSSKRPDRSNVPLPHRRQVQHAWVSNDAARHRSHLRAAAGAASAAGAAAPESAAWLLFRRLRRFCAGSSAGSKRASPAPLADQPRPCPTGEELAQLGAEAVGHARAPPSLARRHLGQALLGDTLFPLGVTGQDEFDTFHCAPVVFAEYPECLDGEDDVGPLRLTGVRLAFVTSTSDPTSEGWLDFNDKPHVGAKAIHGVRALDAWT